MTKKNHALHAILTTPLQIMTGSGLGWSLVRILIGVIVILGVFIRGMNESMNACLCWGNM